MTKVSTRPRQGATTVTVNPTAVTRTGADSITNVTAAARAFVDEQFDPYSQVTEAVAVIDAAVQAHAKAAIWGIQSLASGAAAAVLAAYSSDTRRDADELQHASDSLDQAIAVLEMVNQSDEFDCVLLHAADTLLILAKHLVDADVERAKGPAMSAVAAKPRAEATKAPAPMKSALEALHAELFSAREKVTLAYDAAEMGTTADTLLRYVEEALLPDALAPIYRKDLTSAGVDTVYRALFVPLAVIEGAIAVSTGTVIEHTLREAHALLDSVHGRLDAAEEIARSLPDTDAKADDFERGKQLAISLIYEAEALMDEREGMRWMRDGKAQDNVVKGYLDDIFDEPALIDGFTAVLSATLRNDHMDLSEVRKITLAETQAGELGADGTEPHPDSLTQTSVREQPRREEPIDDAEGRRRLAFDANHEMSMLAEGMDRLLGIERDDDYLIYHGMLTRIQLCSEITLFAMKLHGEPDADWGERRTLADLERAFKGMLT